MKTLTVLLLLLSVSCQAQLLPDWQIRTLTRQLADSTATLKNARERLAYYEQQFDRLKKLTETQNRRIEQLAVLPDRIYRIVDERDQRGCFLGLCWHRENRKFKRELKKLTDELVN